MLTQAQQADYWGHECYPGPYATVALFGAGHATIRPEVIEAASALSACLKVWAYETEAADTGGYSCRHKTGDVHSISNHGRGIAIDINWKANPYGHVLVTNMPRAMIQAICGIRTNSGAQVWNWGGNWFGNKDAMHFEVVCTPHDLSTGINWLTVPGAPALTPLAVRPGDDDDMFIMINPHQPIEHWLSNGITRRPVDSTDEEAQLTFLNSAIHGANGPNIGPFPVKAELFDGIKVDPAYAP